MSVEAPEYFLHGTDVMSALFILKKGFKEPEAYFRASGSEPGWVYGTCEAGWAEAYARGRARQVGARAGALLRVDVRGLPVEVDQSVACAVAAPAYRVPLRLLTPERVSFEREVELEAIV